MSLRSCNTSKLITKYPVYNHLYEIKSPYSACVFNNNIYACIGNTIHEFDIETQNNSKILISDYLKPRSVTNAICSTEKLIFLGSYDTRVFVIDKNACRTAAILSGQRGGVIQCLAIDNLLYVGGRKDNFILMWDIRNTIAPICRTELSRNHQTNQRILFDVNSGGSLIAGNFDGSIVTYNHFGEIEDSFFGHFDSVNSVQFYQNGIVSSCGQRHYDDDDQNRNSMIRVWENLPKTDEEYESFWKFLINKKKNNK